MKEDSIATLTIALTVTAALSAAVLASAAYATKEPIAEAQAKATAEALRMLEPNFDNHPPAEIATAQRPDGAEAVFYPI